MTNKPAAKYRLLTLDDIPGIIEQATLTIFQPVISVITGPTFFKGY
jgi:hypothetical protein